MRLCLTGFRRLAACSVVVLVAACGGGGGGGAASGGSSGNGSLSGVAAKGLLSNALVTAYCGLASSGKVIGTATTNSLGNYSLSLTQACASPVQLVVSATSSTTMLDEIAGSVPVPSNFTMSAFVVGAAAGSPISSPITPFTDMAAALVERSSSGGTLSNAIVSNANQAIVTNVLGGNAELLTAQPLPPSQYSDVSTTQTQKQLITLLTAISAAAAQSTTTGTTGEKVQAILEQLSAQATQTITSVSSGSYEVATTVNATGGTGATATPLDTIRTGMTAISSGSVTVQGGEAISTAIADNIEVVKVAIVDSSATQIADGGTVTSTVITDNTLASAISAAKILFASLRANFLSVSNPQETGFLQTQAAAIEKDVTGLALDGTYHFVDIVSAAQRATAVLIKINDAKFRRVDPTGLYYGVDDGNYFFGNYQFTSDAQGIEWWCRGYYSGPNVDSNNSGNPIAVCTYPIGGSSNQVMQFVVKSPVASADGAGSNTFTYINRLRVPCTTVGCTPVDSGVVTGTLTASWNANAQVTGMTVASGPIISYKGNPTTMDFSFTGADANGTRSIDFTGALTSGSLKYGFGTGSKFEATSFVQDGVAIQTGKVKLVGSIETGQFKYDGTVDVDVTDSVRDNAAFGFTGSISSKNTSGAYVPFLEGTLAASGKTKAASFSTKITNGSKFTHLTASFSGATTGQLDVLLTFAMPGYSIKVEGIDYADYTKSSSLTAVASDGTRIEAVRAAGAFGVLGATSTTVKSAAGTVIGTGKGLTGNNQIDFTDNTYIALN